MKVLFLDCDGVLNDSNDLCTKNGRCESDDSIYVLNLRKVRLLKKIIEDTGCKIVLSSVWRLSDEGIKTLEYYGINIHDVTPSMEGPRGNEIQWWLDNKGHDVKQYAIVDDDGDMLPSHFTRFFQTDHDFGLTDTIAYRITYSLNNQGWRTFNDYPECSI